MVEPEGLQMTSQYGACALHAGLAMLYASTPTHTQTNTQYCFSTAKTICESTSVLSHLYIGCLV